MVLVKTNLCWLLICLPVLLGGCSREAKAPPPTTDAATAPASPRGPQLGSETPAAATVIPDSGDTHLVLQQLTQTLRDYVVRTRSVPKDFDEFAAKSQVSFPPAPQGKKYVIKAQEIVLVTR